MVRRNMLIRALSWFVSSKTGIVVLVLVVTGAVAAVYASGYSSGAGKWERKYLAREAQWQQQRADAQQAATERLLAARLEHEARERELAERSQEIEAQWRSEYEKLQARKQKTRVIYREALENDPDCAAQAKMLRACPLSVDSWVHGQPPD